MDRRTLWKSPGLTPIDERRRSGVCKLEMMRAVHRLEAACPTAEQGMKRLEEEKRETYFEMKQGTAYQAVKSLLRGQIGETRLIPGFEKCGMLSSTEAPLNEVEEDEEKSARPPFAGWIVSGEAWESIDREGGLTRRIPMNAIS